MSLDLQSPAFLAKRDAMRVRAAESQVAFEERRLALAADRALVAETAEVMQPEDFVARLAGLKDPFDTVPGDANGEKTDHEG